MESNADREELKFVFAAAALVQSNVIYKLVAYLIKKNFEVRIAANRFQI